MINKKEGITQSAKVKPVQYACAKHGKTSPIPAFTMIISITVRPRNKSMLSRRWGVVGVADMIEAFRDW